MIRTLGTESLLKKNVNHVHRQHLSFSKINIGVEMNTAKHIQRCRLALPITVPLAALLQRGSLPLSSKCLEGYSIVSNEP